MQQRYASSLLYSRLSKNQTRSYLRTRYWMLCPEDPIQLQNASCYRTVTSLVTCSNNSTICIGYQTERTKNTSWRVYSTLNRVCAYAVTRATCTLRHTLHLSSFTRVVQSQVQLLRLSDISARTSHLRVGGHWSCISVRALLHFADCCFGCIR